MQSYKQVVTLLQQKHHPPQYKLITLPHKIKLHISIKSTSNACGVEILDVWSVEQMLWQVALFKGGMR